MNSLRQRLYDYLRARPNEWVNGAILEDYARTLTHKKKGVSVPFKASNASRRLRELAETGQIVPDERESVYYCYKPKPKPQVTITEKDGHLVALFN